MLERSRSFKNPLRNTRQKQTAKAGGTCLIIFNIVVLIRNEMGNFKNLKLGFYLKSSYCSIKMNETVVILEFSLRRIFLTAFYG